MAAETPLGPQFSFGWNEKKGKKFKTKAELTEHKVCLRGLCLGLCLIALHNANMLIAIYSFDPLTLTL